MKIDEVLQSVLFVVIALSWGWIFLHICINNYNLSILM